jgi:putative peptidoglycan lipid II flippase
MMLMLNVPATVGSSSSPRRSCSSSSSAAGSCPPTRPPTAAAARFYAIGLVGYSAVRIASPTFYAIGDSRVPAMVSGGAIAVNVIASVRSSARWGFEGLALGTSIASMCNGAALLWLLRRRLGSLGRPSSVGNARQSHGVVSRMAMASVAIQHEMVNIAPGSGLPVQRLRLGASIGGGIAALA